MTETERKWSERVSAWKASGQTAQAFAQGREFKASTLTYWAYRLRQAGAPYEETKGDRQVPTSVAAPVRIVRVRRTPVRRSSSMEEARGPSSPTIVIAVGPVRIEVQPGFDRGLFAEVVEALGGGR